LYTCEQILNKATNLTKWLLKTRICGREVIGEQVGVDISISWSNNSSANTQKEVVISIPEDPVEEYMLIIYNPSLITDVSFKVFNIEGMLGGAERYAFLTNILCSKKLTISGTEIEAYAIPIHGIYCGTNLKMVLSNDSPLGATEGFTLYFRLRKVM